jgi:hypothetical protein
VVDAERARQVGRAVRRAIVDDHELLVDPVELDGAYLIEELSNRGPLVVDRNDDRELQDPPPVGCLPSAIVAF